MTYQSIDKKKFFYLQKRELFSDKRVLFMCLSYAIIFGFRYDYLNDWFTYFAGFNSIKEGYIEWSIQREPGFFYLQYLLGALGFSGYSIFIVQGFLWIYGLCYLLKDNRKCLIFVLPFVFLGDSIGLILTRQFLAMSLIYIGYRMSLDDKNTKAWIFYLLSISVHFSAVLWFAVFILLKRVKSLNPFVIFPLFVFLSVLSSVFFGLLVQSSNSLTAMLSSAGITSKDYDTYVILQRQSEATVASSRQLLTLGLTRALYLIAYYECKRKGFLEDRFLNNFVILGILGIFTDLVMGYNIIFARFGAYLTSFYFLGYGILAYITLIDRRTHINALIRIGVILVLFYYLGSMYVGLFSPPSDPTINKYLIYQLSFLLLCSHLFQILFLYLF